MPGCSGLRLAQELAAIRSDLPVVISSGYVSEESRADAIRAGVRDVLRKGYILEELGTLVHRVLSEVRA